MKSNYAIYLVLLSVLLLPLLLNCKKEVIKTLPTVTLSAVSNITAISATFIGEVTADGNSAVVACGVCWSTGQNPSTLDSKTTNGTGIGSFTGSITGLTAGTTYNLRAYATNSVGTAYNSLTTFKTLALAPVLTTTDFSAVTAVSFNSGGNITNDGGSSVTVRGVCWSINQNPTITDSKTSDGTGVGSFSSAVSGLTQGTTYYLRAYATNSIGTTYGNQITTKTLAVLPTITTVSIANITSISAFSGGVISSDGGGSIIARGVCWGTSQNPTTANSKTTDGTGTGSFSSSITGLLAGTTYYVRAYATNSIGTGYGAQVSFSTSDIGIIFNPNISYGTLNDIEGNLYKTIQIGTQVWMAENLKTTKYKDGAAIPLVTDNTAWYNRETSGYCWYNNDASTNKNIYGALYNWHTVTTGKLCPTGWHVPSNAEWTTLTTYLGGEAGGKLKETGTSHWTIPNEGATNTSGFTAVPGGNRDISGSFRFIGYYGNYWSSTEESRNYAWGRYIYNSNSVVARSGEGKLDGFSVRCVKD